jgi:hypothetical protein
MHDSVLLIPVKVWDSYISGGGQGPKHFTNIYCRHPQKVLVI